MSVTERKRFEILEVSLKCVSQSHGRGASLRSAVSVVDLLYQLLNFTSVSNKLKFIYVDGVQLN